MTTLGAGPAAGLAERLRAGTRAEHAAAERAPFVVALLDGRVSLAAYATMLSQNWIFYSVLESAGRFWRADPIAGPFVAEALYRRPALESDLAWLRGPAWRDEVWPLPATRRYVDRLREVCFTSTAAFVAHHYTRYLGDLSGGQIIRNRLRTHYGLSAEGTRFYVFDGIAKPKPFKDAYRRRLDATPWSAADQDDLVTEANGAFAFNRGVFDDLALACGVAS